MAAAINIALFIFVFSNVSNLLPAQIQFAIRLMVEKLRMHTILALRLHCGFTSKKDVFIYVKNHILV